MGLKPDTSYLVGRDENSDFVVDSKGVSRQQLRIVVSPNLASEFENTDFVTPISIEVLSRARSCINGRSYKLGKTDTSPVLLWYSTDESIEILFKNVEGKEESITTSVIRWIPFNVAVSEHSLSGRLNDFVNLGMDTRFANAIENATHLLAAPNSTAHIFKLALLMSIPVITPEADLVVLQMQEVVDKWLLAEDYSENYPPEHRFLVPINDRALLLAYNHGIVISGDKGLPSHDTAIQYMEWISSLGGKSSIVFVKGDDTVDKIHEKIEAACGGAGTVFFMTSLLQDTTEASLMKDVCDQYCYLITTEIELLKNVKKSSIAGLKSHALGCKKRPAIEASAPPIRKRMRYQKVDKMHFFDLDEYAPVVAATATGILQPNADINSQVLRENAGVLQLDLENYSGDRSSKTTEISNSVPDMDPKQPHRSYIAGRGPKPLNGEANIEMFQTVPEQDISGEVKNIPKDEMTEGDANLKRKLLESTQKRKFDGDESKICVKRFKPKVKVSLVDAIKRAKDSSVKDTNEFLGIGATQPTQSNLEREFNSLVLVETVSMERLKPKVSSCDPTDYAGRKNYKPFRKNMALKSNVTRTFIDMSLVAINNEISFVSAGLPKTITGLMNAKKQLQTDFKDIMGSVNGYEEPNELFVADSSSDYDDEAQPSSRLGRNGTFENTGVAALVCHHGDDDDDDDDDDDGQPKFGFRTVI